MFIQPQKNIRNETKTITQRTLLVIAALPWRFWICEMRQEGLQTWRSRQCCIKTIMRRFEMISGKRMLTACLDLHWPYCNPPGPVVFRLELLSMEKASETWNMSPPETRQPLLVLAQFENCLSQCHDTFPAAHHQPQAAICNDSDSFVL